MIYESIVTTVGINGQPHIAPMGIRREGELIILAPFRPSTTLENLQRTGCAVVNFTDDVRVFAGCLTGRYDWPTRPASKTAGFVLEQALAHTEIELARWDDDPVRPRFYGRTVYSAMHKPFAGFNRAQAAVIEAAILVSRLPMLPPDKIDREIDYLSIAVEKTAGPWEQEAWHWLLDKIAEYRQLH